MNNNVIQYYNQNGERQTASTGQLLRLLHTETAYLFGTLPPFEEAYTLQQIALLEGKLQSLAAEGFFDELNAINLLVEGHPPYQTEQARLYPNPESYPSFEQYQLAWCAISEQNNFC